MEAKPLENELTDGIVILRRPSDADTEVLIGERDADFHRFIGVGSPEPMPTAVVLNIDRQIVGWIDYDIDRDWLAEGEVNIGYNVFAEHRGQGFARRSLALLVEFLAENVDFTAATLLVDPANAASIRLAERAGFSRHGDIDGQIFFTRLAGAAS